MSTPEELHGIGLLNELSRDAGYASSSMLLIQAATSTGKHEAARELAVRLLINLDRIDRTMGEIEAFDFGVSEYNAERDSCLTFWRATSVRARKLCEGVLTR